jgi:hypothetical protein
MKSFTVLLAFAGLVACGARSSDEQQVRDVVAKIEAAAEDRDASDVLEFVADGYEDGNGFDKARLQNFLRGYFLAHPKLELLANISNLEFPADGLARAEISVTSLALEDADRVRLKVEFRRDGAEWRVARADRLGR